MNTLTISPEFTAKYKAWLDYIGPELWGPVGKADYEQILSEEAAAKQVEPSTASRIRAWCVPRVAAESAESALS